MSCALCGDTVDGCRVHTENTDPGDANNYAVECAGCGGLFHYACIAARNAPPQNVSSCCIACAIKVGATNAAEWLANLNNINTFFCGRGSARCIPPYYLDGVGGLCKYCVESEGLRVHQCMLCHAHIRTYIPVFVHGDVTGSDVYTDYRMAMCWDHVETIFQPWLGRALETYIRCEDAILSVAHRDPNLVARRLQRRALTVFHGIALARPQVSAPTISNILRLMCAHPRH